MCSSQVPWAISATEAYGFAAVSASESECCQCYQLTFTSEIVGKTMIVQATNTGGDVGSTQFDLAVSFGPFLCWLFRVLGLERVVLEVSPMCGMS